ncbi:hypothetical protein [Nocardia mexicana]|nr:hypothetical protein [Nocardia mexicana]
MSTVLTRLGTVPKYTRLSLCGLAIAIAGLVIQWIAEPSKFPGFPPGILVIAVCAAVVAFGARWRWTPTVAMAIALWIVIGGFLSGELTENLASGDIGTITGNVVMCLGLVAAAITAAMAMVRTRRAGPR